jgi:hypothetical protein
VLYREALGLPWYVWAFMALSVLVRLVFWATTHRVWEDALITLAPVRNVFTPIGLTHHGGEGRVYSFTSALSVLIPLTGEVIQRGSGLLALRLASLVTAPFATLFTYLICRRLEVGFWPGVLAMTYVAAEHEQVLFGIGGMETQVATAILLASIYFVLEDRDIATGITFGLAMLARPDFILWVLPAGLYLARKGGVRRAVKLAALTTLVYGPWLLFTLLYYGTIIPNTIKAKALVYSPLRLLIGAGRLGPTDWVVNALHFYGPDLGMFAPYYDTGSASAAPLPLVLGLMISLLVGVLAAQGAWRTRHVARWLPAIVYAGLFLVYRVFFLGAASFGWYLPPFRAVAIILAACGFGRLRVAFPRGAPVFAGALAALFLIASISVFPIDARVQQIENSVRIGVGQYLGQNATPQQTLVSESAGYVGYYSRAELHDYPGLTSPTSYRTLLNAPPQDRSLVYLIEALRPDWVVLRPVERTYLQQRYPDAYAQYTVAKVFQSNISLDFLGVHQDDIDTKFYVLRHR